MENDRYGMSLFAEFRLHERVAKLRIHLPRDRAVDERVEVARGEPLETSCRALTARLIASTPARSPMPTVPATNR